MGDVWPRCALVAAIVLVTGACSGGGSRTAGPPASPAERAPGQTTTTTAPVVPAPARPGDGTCPTIPERATPVPDRPRYDLQVDVRPAANTVLGRVAVRFTPDVATDRLVFRLWPNGPRTARAGARLDVRAVTVGGRAVPTAQENPTTLVVRPQAALVANRPVDATVDWQLTLPGPVNDRVSRSGDAIRLGSFFPILAWEPGVGWAVRPPTSGFAEASAAVTADFTATVVAPPGFDVLATGTTDGGGRWKASAVPDFAVSVGHFTTASATVNAPRPVQVTVGVHAGLADSPSVYLSRVTGALGDFASRYGPYPWPSFTMAVTPELDGGIEYPMHVLQGPGTDGPTTTHEVAHMWFYALVGSDQGRDPWLDEGLASWAESRAEGTLHDFLAKAVPTEGRGRAGEAMTFWEGRQGAYYRSVYVQPVQALAALGPPDRVDCVLRLYVAGTAYRVARPRDLIEAASAVFPGAAATLARFGIRA
ncbi:MAG: hypothetical protein M3396_07670 [Actinomycetota bacterium]|nr:hypothetical protein [Actinomycetota bacterium]